MIAGLKELLVSHHYTFWYKMQVLSLLVITLTLPFSITANNIAIGALVLTWLLSGNLKTKLTVAFQNKLFLLFAAVFLIQLLGLFYTDNLTTGLGKIERKAALIIFPLVLVGAPKLETKHVHALLIAFIAACTALSLYALGNLYYTYGTFTNIPHLTETIDHIIDLHHAYSGMYIVFASAAALYLCFEKDTGIGKKGKGALLLVSVFLIVFLIILAARTAFVVGLMLLCILLVNKLLLYKKKTFILYAVLAVAVLAAVILSLPNTKTKIAEFYQLRGVHSPFTPRLIKWECCFRVLEEQDAWFVGVGTGDVQDHLQKCYTDMKFWGDQYKLNAHNEFLEEMVRHGMIGLAIFLISLLFPFVLSLRKGNYIYVIFLFVFMVCSLTESTLSRQNGVVFYALFNSIFAFSYIKSSEAVAPESRSKILQA